jgi:hypothetical protein
MRIPLICLVAAGAIALGGCGYNGLGVGLGYGSPYGYGNSYGYGGYGGYGNYAGYGGRYGYNPYYGSYGDYASGRFGYGGLGYGYQPYGWYDGLYYPGTGYYVYDSYRRPRYWSDAQRVYWTNRVRTAPTPTTTVVRPTSPNWSGFDRTRSERVANRAVRQERILQDRSDRRERLDQRRTERRATTANRTRVVRQSRRDD